MILAADLNIQKIIITHVSLRRLLLQSLSSRCTVSSDGSKPLAWQLLTSPVERDRAPAGLDA